MAGCYEHGSETSGSIKGGNVHYTEFGQNQSEFGSCNRIRADRRNEY